jgi:hypothetical protein
LFNLLLRPVLLAAWLLSICGWLLLLPCLQRCAVAV